VRSGRHGLARRCGVGVRYLDHNDCTVDIAGGLPSFLDAGQPVSSRLRVLQSPVLVAWVRCKGRWVVDAVFSRLPQVRASPQPVRKKLRIDASFYESASGVAYAFAQVTRGFKRQCEVSRSAAGGIRLTG
jgi:hypothetical protein